VPDSDDTATARWRDLAHGPDTPRLVLVAAVALVAAHGGFRAWALFGSWFYTDDYRLLYDARQSPLDWAYAATPFDNQFMPLGRAIAWLVSQSGQVNWPLAASITLALQLLASLAMVWMLVTLFGPRWGILGPLALYLTCAVTMPALMWWAASLNQLPLQVVFFLAVGSGVRYARTRALSWLVICLAVLALGLLAYVKTLLVVGIVAYLVVVYFSAGGVAARVREVLTTYRLAALTTLLGSVAFAVYYSVHVPSIFQRPSAELAADLASSLVGTSLATGLMGGPWRWDTSNPPTGYADPPLWSIIAAWLLLAIVVSVILLRRRGSLPAWALLVAYVVAAYVLVLVSRAPVAGADIGYEYRYLTDVIPVAAACLGLATMRLLEAPHSSEPREEPLLTVAPRTDAVCALVGIVGLSGVASSAAYVRIWHHDNPGDAYTHRIMATLGGRGSVDLADQIVPAAVIPPFSAPANTTSRLVPLLVDNARFPTQTDRLVVLTDEGEARLALIDVAVASPGGPVDGCGWPIEATTVEIPLEGATFDYQWWVRMGYLGADEGSMEVRAGDTTVTVPVHSGLHNAYLRADGQIGSVTVTTDDLTNVCVDTVEVGLPVPGDPW